MSHASDHLLSIHNFNDLVLYLEEKLGWPLQEYGFDDLTFQYDAEELGLKDDDAAKVKAIHQLRPLQHGQPWGIFFVEFEKKKLPVVVLRRILSHLVVKKRASANKANEAAWHAEDLLFVTAFGDEDSVQREIAFAHFHQSPGDMPTLRVLGWDGGDTPLKLSHLDAVLQQRLHWPDDTTDHAAWRQQWRAPFKHKVGHVIRTADALAEALATLARGINDKAKRMLAAESDNGPLRKLHKAFQAALIHDLTEENFADTYAQTITYGLLTAAISRTEGSEGRHGTFIVADNVSDMVPITNPFLKEMLQTFLKVGGRKGGIDFDELGIQDVVDLLRGDETDLPAILRDFGNKTQGEDPVIHFYEHFLAAYNKKLKVQRGVFYTPKPAVSYIVRSVHELLKTDFGLDDGLASVITWGEMAKSHPEIKIPAGTSPDTFFVMVLDPATGTATFLVEVIDVIHKTMIAKWQKQGKREQEIAKLWNEYIPEYLLPRLHGYELMMAPYAIAHMKIGLKLFETGYQFMSEERVRVYLTNALEPASDDQHKLIGIVPALAHEADAVNAVKRNVRFTVVVGNPPYSNFGMMNKIPWILDLLEDYKRGLNEKKLNMDDDFIKFLRLAQFTIKSSGSGILGFITNNTYFDGITHRQMRFSILKDMSSLLIVDLHGSSSKKEKCPDGSKDENIFDIQQGVGISIWSLLNHSNNDNSIYFGELWGTRENKYKSLSDKTANKLHLHQLNPTTPYHFFVPKDFSLASEFESEFGLADIFIQNGPGVKTERDRVSIHWSNDEIHSAVDAFRTKDEEYLRKAFDLETDSRDWKVNNAKEDVLKHKGPEYFRRILYRPFDDRHIWYSGQTRGFVGTPGYPVMKHLLQKNALGLVAMRQFEYDVPEYCYFFVTEKLTECRIFVSNRGIANCFPLYMSNDTTSPQGELAINSGRSTNFKPQFLEALSKKLNLQMMGSKGVPKGLTPEDIFNYMYSVFHSPTYRSRYAEFLKIEFPRVPLTTSLELFRLLSKLGGELVALHLLESPTVNNFITTFTGKGDNSIPKKPTWQDNAVQINPTQCFEGVPENVWNFYIGGYQVCEKWLKDRKGRTLSEDDITHYQRIVVSLSETIRIMDEIDEVIDEHGGWPIK